MAKPCSKTEGDSADDLNSYRDGHSRLRRVFAKFMKRRISKLRRQSGKKDLKSE